MKENETKEIESIDFFDLGAKFASKTWMMMKEEANKIEKQYGRAARSYFESGYAAYVPVYEENDVKINTDNLRGTGESHFGVSNTRNNSYFGGHGTSFQYIDGKYIEPKKSSK